METKHNDLIGQQAREIQELKRKLERALFKNRQQKAEIRRLNTAIIKKNYVVKTWSDEVAQVRGTAE